MARTKQTARGAKKPIPQSPIFRYEDSEEEEEEEIIVKARIYLIIRSLNHCSCSS